MTRDMGPCEVCGKPTRSHRRTIWKGLPNMPIPVAPIVRFMCHTCHLKAQAEVDKPVDVGRKD